MTTYKRICITTHTIKDSTGAEMTLERGREYLTSEEKDGEVCVFSTYWVYVPAVLFAGAQLFTGAVTEKLIEEGTR